jgi:hypothetical protein
MTRAAPSPMGKHELISSDIDISLFWEPEAAALADGVEPQRFVDAHRPRLLRSCCRSAPATAMCSAPTCACGPIPSSTPPVSPSTRPDLLRGQSARTGSGRPSSRRGRSPGDSRRQDLPEGLSPLHLAQSLDYRGHRRHPFDQAADPRPQGPRLIAVGAQPQARARRHPRDRVLRPDPAADPGRPPQTCAARARSSPAALRDGRSCHPRSAPS